MAFNFSFGGGTSSSASPAFGTPASSQPAPAASTPGFSFGTPAASNSSASAGMFGKPAAQSTPSLFGGAQPATSASGFSFGTPASSQTQQTSLFGQSQQGTSLFGNTATSQSASPFSFGQSTATSQPGTTASNPFAPKPANATASPFSFGSSTVTSQPQQTKSLFGSTANTQSTAGFGLGAQQNPFGQSQQPQPSLSQSILAPPSSNDPNADLASKLSHIQAAWNASDPTTCAFKTYVYNVMDAQTAQWIKSQNGGQTPRTQNDVDEELWIKAVKENPDKEKFLPSLLVGHDALAERVKLQDEMAGKHAVKLEEFQTQLRQLNSKHTLETSLRLQRARHAQSVLSARLIHLVARLHQLTPLRGSPIRAEEESLASALDACVRGMGGRGVESSTMQDKVNELWVLIAQKKARRSALAEEEERMAEWAVSNESEALKVLQVLAQQQRTLDYLTNVVQKDAAVLDVIKQGFGEGPISGALGQAQ